jgi:HK97 family phage major capsid protein
MLFFGNFQQGVAFGERKGITVQVLRERYAEYRQIGVLATERIDINCHGVGSTSAAGPIVALIGG